MELWIRSQDKKVLTKCNDIRIETTDTNKMCVIRKYFNDNNWIRLGIYKTKERGIEVLDEMQSKLKPQILVKRIGQPDQPPQYTFEEQNKETIIYEMPKE